MYEIILDSMIDEMQNFGLVSTILISVDYYDSMSQKQIDHLESLMDMCSNFKWMLINDKKEYFSFIYSTEPYGIL